MTTPEHRHKPERGRMHAMGRSTEDGGRATLVIVHEVDGAWTFHGLGAPGVTLSEGDMVALAESILVRARPGGTR
ncbi:MAG: hypothetical protein ACRDTH_14805 [Pseudonocardiaceae bacterium]